MMKLKTEDVNIILIIIMSLVLIILLISIIISGGNNETVYKLPDGITCDSMNFDTPGRREFYDCDDNRTYINPDYFEKIEGDV